MAKKNYHHIDLRSKLLEVAAQMIEENSVEAVTMRGLAERVGVSRSAAYRHFKDKTDLLAAVAEDGFNRLTECIRKAKNDSPGDTLQRLQNAFIAYIDFVIENPAHYRLMFGRKMFDKADYPSLRSAGIAAYNELLISIKMGQQDQKPDTGITEKKAYVLWVLVHGLSLSIIDGHISVRESQRDLAIYAFNTIIDGMKLQGAGDQIE